MEILAILGRGIQKLRESDPNSEVSSWHLTEDLEVCTDLGAHLAVRVPVDDTHPNCLVGGGQMNLEAGKVLILQHAPQIVVYAFGNRSAYLKEAHAPSESEVTTEALHMSLSNNQMIREPEMVIWHRTHSTDFTSNTRQEILNIFDLAIERELTRIGFVTIGVHIPRTATFMAKHISTNLKYQHLSPVMFESEEVLLCSSKKWKPRVDALRNSHAFRRNLANEFKGISAVFAGKYNTVNK